MEEIYTVKVTQGKNVQRFEAKTLRRAEYFYRLADRSHGRLCKVELFGPKCELIKTSVDPSVVGL